jgi:hypothetical protein
MNILKQYSSLEDNNESLYTIIIHNKIQKEAVVYFEAQLEKAKKINDPIKKTKINNQLFQFIKYMKDNYEEEETIHSIFLLHKKIVNYPLTQANIETAVTYDVPKIFMKNDNFLDIDYLLDLFENFTFFYSLKINKNELSVYEFNKNKHCILETVKITTEEKIVDMIQKIKTEKQYKESIVLFGQSPFIDKLPILKKVIIEKKMLSHNEMYEVYEQDRIKENHVLLKKRIDDMQNSNTNLDLYVFGKLKLEIKDAIECYSIKELYITKQKLDKLKTFVENEFFNFKIILIESLEPGDIAEQFIKDYNGMMGIKYY